MYESHPNAIPHLDGIRDNSMGDVFCPWKVKNEPKEEFDDNGFSDNDSHDETFYIPETDTKDYQKDVKLEDDIGDNDEAENNGDDGSENNQNNSILVCDVCDLVFSKRGNLKYHKRSVHEGKKIYKCHMCVKAFTTETILQNHLDALSSHSTKFTAINR